MAQPPREPILSNDCCALAERWGVHIEVVLRLILAAIKFRARTGRNVLIISGYRSLQEQAELERAGRPAAPDHLSTHRSLPATGIDVSFSGLTLSREERRQWGEEVIAAGMRWGGGSRFVDGIPIDWQHVDLGPRVQKGS